MTTMLMSCMLRVDSNSMIVDYNIS